MQCSGLGPPPAVLLLLLLLPPSRLKVLLSLLLLLLLLSLYAATVTAGHGGGGGGGVERVQCPRRQQEHLCGALGRHTQRTDRVGVALQVDVQEACIAPSTTTTTSPSGVCATAAVAAADVHVSPQGPALVVDRERVQQNPGMALTGEAHHEAAR